MTNIVFSPALQAPITLSNPTGSVSVASDPSTINAKVSPVPLQGQVSLIGAAVKMALAMATNAGAVSIGGVIPTVVAGIVTPRAPSTGAVTSSGIAPTVTQASPTNTLTFPRVMLCAVGGDQSYGVSATTGWPKWTTAAAGSAANIAIQQIGAYDIAVLNGTFDNWDSGGLRDRENLTQALLKNGTYSVKLSQSRRCLPFYYQMMMSGAATGGPFQQYFTLVQNNNWWGYESAGGVGTITPTGGGTSLVNYSAAWPGAIGSAGIGASICGSNYGTLSTGSPTGPQGPARTMGNYAALKLLIRNNSGIDSRFTFNAQMASPSCGGIFLDNCFVALDGSGSLPNTSLDGITIAPGSQVGSFPTLDTVQPVLARGNHNMFDQMQIMTATYQPGSAFYNFANFGQYANKYQFGTATLTCGLENTLHGGLLENVLGAGAASWELFQMGNPNTGNTSYPSGWPNLLANYYQGMDFCVAPKMVGVGTKLPQLPDGTGASTPASWVIGAGNTLVNVNTGTALEYQLLRYALCTTLLDDGYFAPGVSGYDYARLRWYDEYGDDSLTQVNVKRGYLGLPLTTRPTSATWAQGPMGVWSRDFTGGKAIVNPRGNGAQTVSLGNTYQALNGTQQTTINNGAYMTSVSVADGDGRIVLGPVPALQITTASPLANATVSTAYTNTYAATGGAPPYTWSLPSATPNSGGWYQIASNGTGSGTPGTVETESLTVQVKDSVGTIVTKAFSLPVISGTGTLYLAENYNGYPAGNITTITSALSAKGYSAVTFTNAGDIKILGRSSMPAGLLSDPNFPAGKTQVALFTLPALEIESRLTWAGFPNTTTRDVSWSWWEYRPNGNNGGEKFHRAGNWVGGTIGGTRGIDYIIGMGLPAGTLTLFSQGTDHLWPDQGWGVFNWSAGGLHHFERVDHLPTDTSATYTSSFYIDGVLQGTASGLQVYDTAAEAAIGWQLWDFGGWASGSGIFPIQRYLCAARIASQRQGVWSMAAV